MVQQQDATKRKVSQDPTKLKVSELVDLKLPFPWKLHKLLQDSQKRATTHIISWHPDGTSFKVHKPKVFTQDVMPSYFCQTKFNSFRRQCYIYGFRLRRDGAFFHPDFLRENLESCMSLRRNQQEDRRKKDVGNMTMTKKEGPEQAKIMSFLNTPTSTTAVPNTMKALNLFESTFCPDDVVSKDVSNSVNFPGLIDGFHDKSKFLDPLCDPIFSVDGNFLGEIPLDSLDEVFQSEMGYVRQTEIL